MIYRFINCILLTILFTGCLSKNSEPKYYHQYYAPVKYVQSYNLMHKAFDEAKTLYGTPRFPVNEIFLFTSKKRDNIAKYAISDIVDWKTFKNKITQNKTLFSELSFPQNFSIKNKIKCIYFLNKIILNSNLTKDTFYLEQSKSKANRKYLDNLFGTGVLPLPKTLSVRTHFSLTEIVDKKKGIYAIYIDADEHSILFKLLLFHEVVHLLSPEVFDWYQEGINNVFSKYMAKKLNISWSLWERRFVSSPKKKNNAYSVSYKMMRDINKIVPIKFNKIIKFVKKRKTIDIDSWLNTLSKNKREQVQKIISKYSKALNKVKGNKNSFKTPLIAK